MQILHLNTTTVKKINISYITFLRFPPFFTTIWNVKRLCSQVSQGSKSLEICPAIFQTWKKSEKMVKGLEFCLIYNKCFLSAFFFFVSFQSYPRPYVLQCIVKKALFLRFLRSILITYLITSSLEKVLNFWSQNLYEPFVWKCSKHECPWNNPRRY